MIHVSIALSTAHYGKTLCRVDTLYNEISVKFTFIQEEVAQQAIELFKEDLIKYFTM